MLSGANAILDPVSDLVCCAYVCFLPGRTMFLCPWLPMKSGRPKYNTRLPLQDPTGI